MDKLYIVIPVLNRWKYTDACLASLEGQSFKDFEIIVVDHGSTDGTRDAIANKYPRVKVVLGDNSMWWTAATNLGINYALEQHANIVLTLNNDTIAESDYVEKILEAYRAAPPHSLIGSAALNAENSSLIYLGEQLNWAMESSRKMIEQVKTRPQNGLIEVTHYPGRGLLIPSEVFAKIGMFDDLEFPHYMADYDFTLRAVRAGFRIYCAWDARLSIFPEASGANALKVRKTFKGYKQHLFGIKGGANLPLFYKYAFRHCPKVELPSYLMLGTVRRIVGYWI